MHDRWRISHAQGYLTLGMVDEAAAELAQLSNDNDSTPVLALRGLVLQEQRQWPLLLPVAAELARRDPAEAGWWVMWAYAARRSETLAHAEAILRDAELRHPADPTIQFNLGCYASQRGDQHEAARRVNPAIALDASFRQQALEDDDLAPLRASGYTPPAA